MKQGTIVDTTLIEEPPPSYRGRRRSEPEALEREKGVGSGDAPDKKATFGFTAARKAAPTG